MKSFESKLIEQQVIDHKLLKTISQITEYRGKQDLYKHQSPQILNNLIEVATIQSTESSNRIEGIIAPHKRIIDLVQEKSTPKNRSEEEIFGYRHVLSLVHQNHRHMSFHANLIRQLHKEIYRYTSERVGHWKTSDNLIEEQHPDGSKTIRFRPASAHLTPLFMEQLHERFNLLWKSQEIEPLLLTATYILDFLCIHPFRDGNGRLSRLISLLLLYQAGYEVGRFISIEKIIEETKEGYYESLQKSSIGWHEGKHDLRPWWNYFCFVVLEAYRQFEKRIGLVEQAKGMKTSMILSAIAQFQGEFSIQDLQEACPIVGVDLLRRVLRQERDSKHLKCLGRGPQAKWIKSSVDPLQ